MENSIPYTPFNKSNIEKVFQKLVSSDSDLQTFYDKYVAEIYEGDLSGRLIYIDIEEIADVIGEKLLLGNTENFEKLFTNIEEILEEGDDYVKNLIAIGLFEELQNETYKEYDQWLKPLSRKAWDYVIDYWQCKTKGDED